MYDPLWSFYLCIIAFFCFGLSLLEQIQFIQTNFLIQNSKCNSSHQDLLRDKSNLKHKIKPILLLAIKSATETNWNSKPGQVVPSCG